MPQSVGDKKYKRILLKLSGEALTGQENFGIDPKILDQMALAIRRSRPGYRGSHGYAGHRHECARPA